jgi:GTP-binding protein
VDLIPEQEREEACAEIVNAIHWRGPVYQISALSGSGTDKLMKDIMAHIEQVRQDDAS